MSGTAGVYFLEGPNGLIKIGRSKDVARRVSALQLGSPVPLTLIGYFGFHDEQGTVALEKGLHRRFALERAHGEWFKPSPEVKRWAALARLVDGRTRFELPVMRLRAEAREAAAEWTFA